MRRMSCTSGPKRRPHPVDVSRMFAFGAAPDRRVFVVGLEVSSVTRWIRGGKSGVDG